MLQVTYVRPDQITRTSVLEPTAEGYQPVRAAQGVADLFTRIYGPTVYSNGQLGQVSQPCPCRQVPGAVPTGYGCSPRFDRPAQAAQAVLPASGAPPKAIYLPGQAGARMVVPNELTAETLARRFLQGVPRMVRVRGTANALDWFHRTGRYY